MRFGALDLLWLDGADLRGRSLLERKAWLRGLVPAADRRLFYVAHVACDGAAFLSASVRREA